MRYDRIEHGKGPSGKIGQAKETYLRVHLTHQTPRCTQEAPDHGGQLLGGLGLVVGVCVDVGGEGIVTAASIVIVVVIYPAAAAASTTTTTAGTSIAVVIIVAIVAVAVAAATIVAVLVLVLVVVVIGRGAGRAHRGDVAVGLQDGAGRPVEHEPGLDAGLLGEAAQRLLDGLCVGGGGLPRRRLRCQPFGFFSANTPS